MDNRNKKELYKDKLEKTIDYLKSKKKVLIITTSNRWINENNKPKSSLLAEKIVKNLKNAKIIDACSLKIYPCEGNVSAKKGNDCGPLASKLSDKSKNPSGYHRCWASLNHKDDELWKISKSLFESDFVLFLGSVRWGQMNSIYQKIIERLTRIENRFTTLKEDNIIKDIEAGIIAIGHNWNCENVVNTQKEVLSFFGFKVKEDICWSWQYTKDIKEESNESYKDAFDVFEKTFLSN